MVRTDVNILVITLVIRTVRPVHRLPTRAAAADPPKTAAEQRPAIILIKLAARLVVPIQQVLTPVALIPFPMVAAELARDATHAATHLLQIGAPYIQPVMVIAAKMAQ